VRTDPQRAMEDQASRTAKKGRVSKEGVGILEIRWQIASWM
jgi:hypothetical protein